MICPESRDRITRLFIRCIGVVWLFNSLSLALQVRRIFCSDGLIPAGTFVAGYAQQPWLNKLLAVPSLFTFLPGGPSDGLLIVLAWTCVVLSALVIAGIFIRRCFALLFVIYLSFVSIGQMLYSFQWDALILETTFLCLLLAHTGFRFHNPSAGVSGVTVWLFLWLLFRLYIESGVAKLFWGPDSWATLQAMSHYYETAPIPTRLGYYAHALPGAWHQFETGATLVIEILAAGLIFGNRFCRLTAFGLFTLFQLCILLTANYGIFNYNTLCLHLFLLTDRDLAVLLRPIRKFTPFAPDLGGEGWGEWDHLADNAEREPPRSSRWLIPVAILIVICSLIEFMALAGGRVFHQTVLAKIHRYTGATHISSRYHLFGPIDPVRYELEIEGSDDGVDWRPYVFPYKAGPLDRPPPFVAPHHPRVDFRLWFEKHPMHGSGQQRPYPDISITPSVLPGYLARLCDQIITSPLSAARHFDVVPFEGRPPRELRIVYHHYRITDPATLAQTGRYWASEPFGAVYIDPRLGRDGRPQGVLGRTTNQSLR